MESIENIVKDVLESNEESRLDNSVLIKEVLKKLGWDLVLNPISSEKTAIYNIPSFSTITRVKRRIQEENHALLPDKDMLSGVKKINVIMKEKRVDTIIDNKGSCRHYNSFPISAKPESLIDKMWHDLEHGVKVKNRAVQIEFDG